MRFVWIKTHEGDWPMALMCRTLKVSRSGYYAWKDRPMSHRVRRRTELVEQIRQAHQASRRIYGSPRVYRQLKDQGVACCQNTVAKLMRIDGLASKMKKAFKVKTTDSRHGHAVAPNTLDQNFEPAEANRTWASDLTYIPTRQGWLYLAVVLDLWSRRVIGWAMADHLKASLAIDALTMAVEQRRLSPGSAVLHHSDRGVQYACDAYRTMLEAHGIGCSMSRTGNCYDNAVVESFFGTLKTELTHHEDYQTREQAMQSIFEYIEVFYNRQRKHSSLSYVAPAQFEAAA
jgi:transposase InsO family protein